MSDIQKESEYLNKHIEECKSRIETIQHYIESNEDSDCSRCKKNIEVFQAVIAALQEKQHNDELRQQGRLVELPCAIGEYVYRIVKTGASETYTIMHEGHEYSREVPFWGIWPCEFNLKLMDEFGKTVFPTYEAAQEALWEMEKEEGRR